MNSATARSSAASADGGDALQQVVPNRHVRTPEMLVPCKSASSDSFAAPATVAVERSNLDLLDPPNSSEVSLPFAAPAMSAVEPSSPSGASVHYEQPTQFSEPAPEPEACRASSCPCNSHYSRCTPQAVEGSKHVSSDPDARVAPGSHASTVRGRDVWSSWFRALLSSSSSLRSFFHSLRTQTATKHVARVEVWPMPLPFPRALTARARRRSSDAHSLQLGVTVVVLVLSWLHLGMPSAAPPSICRGAQLSQAQAAVVDALAADLQPWNSCAPIDCNAMGRSASKVEAIEFTLAALQAEALPAAQALRNYRGLSSSRPPRPGAALHPGSVIGRLSSSIEHAAKDIETTRLKMRGVPSFVPDPFLDSSNRAWYKHPLAKAAALQMPSGTIPRVQVRCSVEEQLRLLTFLDSSKRLALFPASEIRPAFRAGAFALPKDAFRDRLILDCRPANLLEEGEDRWINSLGSIFQLRSLFLEPGEKLVTFAEDIQEFYHMFVCSEERHRRNALKMTFPPEALQHLSAFHPGLWQHREIVPALATLAMGDRRAVAFAQTAHLSLALRTGKFALEDFLTLKAPVSRKSWQAGLMIDDFALFAKVPLQEAEGGSLARKEAETRIGALRSAYEQFGLPRHAGKAVYGADQAEVWGAEVHGETGIVRPAMKRTVPAMHILVQVCELGCATVKLLEVLSGILVSVFQFKRRFMCLLGEIYAAQRGRHPKDVVQLSPELRQELLAAAALIPLAAEPCRSCSRLLRCL